MPEQGSNGDKSSAPKITIRDFGGLQPNRDPHDISPGMSVHQVNVGPGPSGELRVRLGAKVVQFDQ